MVIDSLRFTSVGVERKKKNFRVWYPPQVSCLIIVKMWWNLPYPRWNCDNNCEMTLTGVGQDRGVRTEDWRSSVAPDLQWRKREGQVHKNTVLKQYQHLITSFSYCKTPWLNVSFLLVQPHTFTSPSSTPTHCPGSTTRCSSVRPIWWWGWSRTESAWSSCCRSTHLFLLFLCKEL